MAISPTIHYIGQPLPGGQVITTPPPPAVVAQAAPAAASLTSRAMPNQAIQGAATMVRPQAKAGINMTPNPAQTMQSPQLLAELKTMIQNPMMKAQLMQKPEMREKIDTQLKELVKSGQITPQAAQEVAATMAKEGIPLPIPLNPMQNIAFKAIAGGVGLGAGLGAHVLTKAFHNP